MKNISLGKILYQFFDQLTYDDVSMLEDIERELSMLEEALMKSQQNNLRII